MKREEIIHSFKGIKIAVEVGVLRGRFASHMAKLDLDELHLIDPWKPFEDYPKKTKADWDRNYEFVQKKFIMNPKVTLHRTDSVTGAKQFPDEHFDLVYIDASHKYDSVKVDIETWLPKVKSGGIIGGHDIDTKGVLKAVGEVFTKWIETTEYDENTKGLKMAKSWFVTKQ